MMLELVNVCKSYKNNHVLDEINIKFREGYIYGIRGDNGSGKTVLLRLLCGLSKCDSGAILWNEKRLNQELERIPHIGALVETPGFLPKLTGYHNLHILAEMQGGVTDDKIVSAMKAVGLNPLNKKRVATYSLGMRQKLGIAQAIMGNPPLILLDEPTNSLDADSIEKIKKLIKSLKCENRIIIIVSHMIDYLDQICDEQFILTGGKLNTIECDGNNRGLRLG